MLRLLIASLLYITLASCNNNSTTPTAETRGGDSAIADLTAPPPSWILQGNIYEVNVRQYTPEGTLNAFARHLDRLKAMGVQTLWFMPLQPIGKEGRKGALGSYYAVSDYRSINPEFGTLEDWKALVSQIHQKGMKVIIDWVPNHTAPDHPWVKSHPEFYYRDSTGVPTYQKGTDWTDTRKIDFSNPQVTDSMIACMKFWITETGIDGYRCDHAQGPGRAFWTRCNQSLRAVNKDLLLLAEAEDDWVYKAGFDMSYAWRAFHVTVDIAAGKRPATALDSVLHFQDSVYPASALYLYFTSNHDENSWNHAEYGTMPGASHAPFAVLTQTLSHAVPLIYSGQEEPVLDSISFFYKDTIQFKKYSRSGFYTTLLKLRSSNPALAADASFKKLRTASDASLYAFEREKGGNKVLVIVNLSNKFQQLKWVDQPSEKDWDNLFLMNHEPVTDGFQIEPWGYVVYERKK